MGFKANLTTRGEYKDLWGWRESNTLLSISCAVVLLVEQPPAFVLRIFNTVLWFSRAFRAWNYARNVTPWSYENVSYTSVTRVSPQKTLGRFLSKFCFNVWIAMLEECISDTMTRSFSQTFAWLFVAHGVWITSSALIGTEVKVEQLLQR
jgi:hypothetical protein